ncbi:MAG TPA: FAD-linked oxidase C-terminal domain-containing protein [Hyphomicrobiales bacterium]|nr:FAD-linked oxidase C-terminal domain-containing protein [Hyphomicrobiales bacterium]
MSGIAIIEPRSDILKRKDKIVSSLKSLLTPRSLVTDEAGRRAFETDALTAYKSLPLAVALPQSTEETADILRFCKSNGLRVVARGAGTSLSGGALPAEDSIVLGLSRMNRVLEVNLESRYIRVQTGITNLGVSGAVSASGFHYAPDPSSQLACTIGGNIAMNSGGAHCLKYGVTVNNVLGLKMVTMEGDVIEFGGAHLDGAGYDFLPLIVGSEGQFGIVTEATLRILPKAENARPMMIGFQSSEAAGGCVSAIIGSGILPVAIEFMDRPAIKVCEEFAQAGYPLDVEALLIVEVEGSESEMEMLLKQIEDIASEFEPSVIKVSQSEEESAAIWKGRKAAFGAIGRIADYYCMDGVIPLSTLPNALNRISEICEKYNLRVANIFHAGDGNLHPLIMYNANDEDEKIRAEHCGNEVLALCVDLGGCLTGEHGVGIEKRELMLAQFNSVDLTQQMRVKSVFDPDWLLNPGKVFPLETQETYLSSVR